MYLIHKVIISSILVSLGLCLLTAVIHYSLLFLHWIGLIAPVKGFHVSPVTWKQLQTTFLHGCVVFMPQMTHLLSASWNRGTWNIDLIDMLMSTFFILIFQDAYFNLVHRFLHKTRIQWIRKIHGLHHRALVTKLNVFDLMTGEPFENMVTLGIANHMTFMLFQMLAMPNWTSFFVAHATGIMLLILGHSCYDIKAGVLKCVGFHDLKEHLYHHRDQRVNLGLYFSFWDAFMGTAHAPND